MSPSEDFYTLLSILLQQTVQNPDAPPAIPLKRWPVRSPEQLLLEDLQAALTALQTGDQNHPPQAKGRVQRYQSIFKTASDGLIINVLETGLVVEANPAAWTLYGYAHDEFNGLHPTSFLHPDSSYQFTKYVQTVQSQGMNVALQFHMCRNECSVDA